MNLSEIIFKIISEKTDYEMWYDDTQITDIANTISIFINSQRCKWKPVGKLKPEDTDLYNTSCEKIFMLSEGQLYAPYCRGCGKQISIMETRDEDT